MEFSENTLRHLQPRAGFIQGMYLGGCRLALRMGYPNPTMAEPVCLTPHAETYYSGIYVCIGTPELLQAGINALIHEGRV